MNPIARKWVTKVQDALDNYCPNPGSIPHHDMMKALLEIKEDVENCLRAVGWKPPVEDKALAQRHNLLCRMAGNAVGGVLTARPGLADSVDGMREVARSAIMIARNILNEAEREL